MQNLPTVRKEPCKWKECHGVEMAPIRFIGSPQLGARMEDLGTRFQPGETIVVFTAA